MLWKEAQVLPDKTQTDLKVDLQMTELQEKLRKMYYSGYRKEIR